VPGGVRAGTVKVTPVIESLVTAPLESVTAGKVLVTGPPGRLTVTTTFWFGERFAVVTVIVLATSFETLDGVTDAVGPFTVIVVVAVLACVASTAWST